MDNTNPYVGPVPYQYEDRGRFFGREQEAELLLSHLISERVVLFYAQSGAGKSSLLNAGITPNLKDERKYDVLPLIRFSRGESENISDLDNIYVVNTLRLLTGGKSAKSLANMRLADYFKAEYVDKRSKEEVRPHWLIFDQFEEFMTIFPEQLHAHREAFFSQLQEALDVDRRLSILFVMREDHIAEMDRYAPFLDDRLQARFRIERLEHDAALKAICEPAEKFNRPFEKQAAEKLVRELSKIHIAGEKKTFPSDYVELVQLQIVCYRLWESLREVPGETITVEDVIKYGDVNKALEDFYDDVVARVAGQTGIQQTVIRRWFEEKLITSTRVRAQVSRDRFSSGGLPNKAADLLLNQEHIIRSVEERGGKWYELAHDRFIDPILRANERWLPKTKTDLSVAAQKWREGKDESYLFRGKRLREAKSWYNKNSDSVSDLERDFIVASLGAEAKTSRIWYSAAILLALALFFTSAYAWQTKQYAWQTEQKSNEAERRLKEAKKQLEDAEKAKQVATKNQEDAVEKLSKADTARNEALKAKKFAEERRQIEAQLRQDAVEQKEIAVTQTTIATTQTKMATKQRHVAEAQQQVSTARLLEVEAERTWDKNDMALAEAYFASALTLDDRLETRSRILEASLQGARKLWVSPTLSSRRLSFDFSADGRVLAFLDNNQRLLSWDTEKGSAIGSPHNVEGEFLNAALSKDGLTDTVLSRTVNPDTYQRELAVTTYNVITGAKIRSFFNKEAASFNLFTFSRDGRLVLAVPNEYVSDGAMVINTETGKAINLELDKEVEPLPIVFSPNGELLAAQIGQAFSLWDTKTGKKVGHIETKDANPTKAQNAIPAPRGQDEDDDELLDLSPKLLAFSPNGQRLAGVLEETKYSKEGRPSTKLTLVVVDVQRRQKIQSLNAQRGTISIAFSSDGQQINLWNGNAFSRWDINRNVVTSGPSLNLPAPSEGNFSDDGRRLAVRVNGQGLQVLDVETGKLLSRLTPSQPIGHQSSVKAVAFSPDGQLLASAGSDSIIILREAASGSIEGILTGHNGEINSIAFSPDGQTLASGGTDGKVRLWNVQTREERKSSTSPTSNEAARGSNSNSNSRTSVATRAPSPAEITSIAFSPNGQTLAWAGSDGVIHFWDVKTERESMRINIDPPAPSTSLTGSPNVGAAYTADRLSKINSIAFSPDGQALASGGTDRKVRLWNVQTGAEVRDPLTGHKDVINSIAFSPDGQTLASGSDDNNILLWDLRERKNPDVLSGQDGAVMSLAFSHDGQRLASVVILRNRLTVESGQQVEEGRGQPLITLWSPQTQKVLTTISIQPPASVDPFQHGIRAVAFSRDGLLASGGDDKAVRVWQVPPPFLSKNAARVSSATLSDDGRLLAYTSAEEPEGARRSTNPIWIKHSDSGKRFKIPVDGIYWQVLSFSPDGRLLAAVGIEAGNRDDKPTSKAAQRLCVWDVEGNKVKQSVLVNVPNIFKLAFSPDNKLLALGEQKVLFTFKNKDEASEAGKVSLLDVQTGKTNQTFKFSEDHLHDFAFSPDNRWLVLGGGARNPGRKEMGKKTISGWNLETGEQKTMIVGRKGAVLSLAFGPLKNDSTQMLLAVGEGNHVDNEDDPTLQLIDLRTWQALPMFSSFKETVIGITFAPATTTGNFLVTSGLTLRLWDLDAAPSKEEDSLILSRNAFSVRRVAFSSDGQSMLIPWGTSTTGRLDMKKAARLLRASAEEILADVQRDTSLRVFGLGKKFSQKELVELLGPKYNFSPVKLKPMLEQPATPR